MKTPTVIEPKVSELLSKLFRKQLQVLAKGSELSRCRIEMGELKKTRDGYIAEMMRIEVDARHLELLPGLKVNEKGYVVAIDPFYENAE